MQKLERTTFETSRAAEYFSLSGLTKQTGQLPTRFGEVVIKELVDNALDAAEYARVVPEITINAETSDGALFLSVADNGNGIPPEVVEKVLNFDTRTSDKAVYRSPTRGAQGNALKTLVGMLHALGHGKAPMLIDSHGCRHLIKVTADPAGQLSKEHVIERCEREESTRVITVLPASTQRFAGTNLLEWGRATALFNPHAIVKIDGFGLGGEHANEEDGKLDVFYKPATDKLVKYTLGDPTSAHWYDGAALKVLVFSHIRHARTGGGRDLPLGEFVRQFKGLSASDKAKAVTQEMWWIKRLSDFEKDPDGVLELLARLQYHSKPPTHKALGRLGKENIHRRLVEFYGDVHRYNYKRLEGYLPSGLPYTFEFAVADVGELGDLFMGVNFSPTFGDPLQDVRFAGPKYEATGREQFLLDGFAHPRKITTDDPHSPLTAVVAHVVTPAPLYLEYGKTRLDLTGGR